MFIIIGKNKEVELKILLDYLLKPNIAYIDLGSTDNSVDVALSFNVLTATRNTTFNNGLQFALRKVLPLKHISHVFVYDLNSTTPFNVLLQDYDTNTFFVNKYKIPYRSFLCSKYAIYDIMNKRYVTKWLYGCIYYLICRLIIQNENSIKQV